MREEERVQRIAAERRQKHAVDIRNQVREREGRRGRREGERRRGREGERRKGRRERGTCRKYMCVLPCLVCTCTVHDLMCNTL